MKEFLSKDHAAFGYRTFAVKEAIPSVPTILFIADVSKHAAHKRPELPSDIMAMMDSLNRRQWLPAEKKKRRINGNLGGTTTYYTFLSGSDDDEGGGRPQESKPRQNLTLKRR